MKYIIIGYTSDINIKTNTAKIKYLYMSKSGYKWTSDISKAFRFHTRNIAECEIEDHEMYNCTTYEVEE